MTLNFVQPHGLKLPLKLFKLIDSAVSAHNTTVDSCAALTLNFRNPSYSVEYGGYHPVEMRLEKANEQWRLIYINDFSYQGHPFAELAKEIDICFTRLRLTTLFGFEHCAVSNYQFIRTFINNFMDYCAMDIYDITVEAN